MSDDGAVGPSIAAPLHGPGTTPGNPGCSTGSIEGCEPDGSHSCVPLDAKATTAEVAGLPASSWLCRDDGGAATSKYRSLVPRKKVWMHTGRAMVGVSVSHTSSLPPSTPTAALAAAAWLSLQCLCMRFQLAPSSPHPSAAQR